MTFFAFGNLAYYPFFTRTSCCSSSFQFFNPFAMAFFNPIRFNLFNYSLYPTSYKDTQLSFINNFRKPIVYTQQNNDKLLYNNDYGFEYKFDYSLLNKDYFPSKTIRKKSSTALSRLEDVGYSAEKGTRLAREAKNGAVGFTGFCAKYTKKAIDRAGLGKYKAGHAYQCDTILDNNPNFKQISTEGLNLDKDLPAGCVLVYEKGVAGYSSQYGHVEITDGNGNAYSDGKTRNIRPGAKVYIPVESTDYYA